tara:strand:- start:229 stop:1944 length:1716 start_codon:yes stop_codon:yes gene_type:complete
MNYTKKDYCENVDTGDTNVPYGSCRQPKYHQSELQMDHKNGNPLDNSSGNLWTICSNCHQRKTNYYGDRNTPGRGSILKPITPAMRVNKTNELIELFENFNKLRALIRKDGILKPFLKTYENGLMNILIGATGIGKTWSIYKEMAPHHFNNGGRLHIALSPITESMNFTEIEDYVMDVEYGDCRPPILRHSGVHGIDWNQVDRKLRLGRNVTLVMSDQYFNGKGRIEKAIQLVKKYKTLVTRDEASYGMLSSYEISKEVTGNHYSSDTNQSFYKNIKKLFEAGAITFGITATPNREMREAIGIDWNIINPKIGELNSKMIPFRSPYGSIHCADWGVDDYWDDSVLHTEMDAFFTKVSARNINLAEFDLAVADGKFEKQKITGMIVAQPAQGNSPKILQSDIVDSLKRDDCKMQSDQTLLVVNDKGWEEYDSTGKLIETGKGNEFQDKLNNPLDPATYIVVINRAVYGVNINTLAEGLMFRKYGNQANDTKEFITLSAEQLVGRFNRLNIDIEKILYLLKHKSVDAFREYMELVARFNIKAPNNEHIQTAFKNFKETHGTSWEEACEYYFNY